MSVVRPLDKLLLEPTGRLRLLWDTFFGRMQDAVNSIQTTGSFTLTAGSSTVVTDARVTAASTILLTPTSASAGALSVYISARTAGVSFTVHTSSGSAAGTETFAYTIIG